MRKVPERSYVVPYLPPAVVPVLHFMQKESSGTKKLKSLDIPTQIEIRHFFFTRKGDKSSSSAYYRGKYI